MPYVDVPDKDLRVWCTINPVDFDDSSPAIYADADPPECGDIDPSKPSLVFCHAATCSQASFTAQFMDPRLRREFNMIGVDGRLHGRTTGGPLERFSVEEEAQSFVDALDGLGLESYSVLGESGLGSTIAIWIALKRPQRVKAVICASPGHYLRSVFDPEKRAARMKEIEAGKYADGMDGKGPVPIEVPSLFSLYFFGPPPQHEARRATYLSLFERRYGLGHTIDDLKNIMLHLSRHDERFSLEQLASITAPVLILQGRDDELSSPLAAAEQWRDSFTGARASELQTIATAPNLLCFTDSNVVNRFVLRFLQRYVVGQ